MNPVLSRWLSYLSGTLAPIILIAGASAQTALLTPDWESQQLKDYLTTAASSSRFDTTAAKTARDRYSLPVLGLTPGFDAPNPAADARGTMLNPSLALGKEDWWPKCAAKFPAETSADDGSGTWYTYNYNFGCIEISISGDRHSEAAPPSDLRDQLTQRGSQDEFYPDDENSDPANVLSISADITRFNIPYVVHISCTDEGKGLCQNRDAQIALLSRLSIVAGAPKDRTP